MTSENEICDLLKGEKRFQNFCLFIFQKSVFIKKKNLTDKPQIKFIALKCRKNLFMKNKIYLLIKISVP